LVSLLIVLTACDSGGGMGSEPEPDPEPGDVEATVEGSVTDAESGDPISGADVSVLRVDADEQLGQATTSGEGSYELSFTVPEDDTPDQLAIEAEAEGFMAKTDTVSFNQSLTQDVALKVVTTEGNASGTVTNEESGEGIEGAAVTGSDPDGNVLFEDTTGANGEYQQAFEVADEPDEVTITADEEDFEAADTTVSFVEEITADFQLSPETTEATASGTVTDEETDDPIEGATITGTSGSGDTLFEDTTDASGEYQKTYEAKVIDQPEEVTVSVEAQDYNSATQTVDFTEQLETNFALAPETVDILVEGTVTSEGSEPLDGATIEAFPAGQDEGRLGQSTSASDGSYELSFTLDVPRTPDEFRLEATADRFETEETSVAFASTINQDFDLKQNRFSLNLSVDGEGSIDTSLLSGDLNENGYLLGSEIEIEVLPDGSNVFFGWEGSIEGSQNPVTVEVTESLEATAEVGTPQEGLSLGISFVQIGSTINEATLFLSNNLPEDVVVTGFTLFDENDSEVLSTSDESLTIEPDDSGGFDIDFGLGAPTPEELEQFETVWEFEFRGNSFEKQVVVGDVLDLTGSFSKTATDVNAIDLEVDGE
jgi:archaellum component FlaF (FlaF/FlaG flagellin family)